MITNIKHIVNGFVNKCVHQYIHIRQDTYVIRKDVLVVKICGLKECIAYGCKAASVGTSGPEGKHGPSLL